MGEKIRDIMPIDLIGSSLMIELNEGYTEKQGRVIHIQNPKFRYALTEDSFYKLAADIMRADVELHYIKEHQPKPDIRLPGEASADDLSPESFAFLRGLASGDMEYRILELRKNVASVLIHPECYKAFHRYAKKEGAVQLEHPYGKRHGFRFLYQMKTFEIYEYKGQYYEIMYQMPCKSLTPKMWMPLDKSVQKAVWENCRRADGYTYVSDEELWIYFMTRCLYTKMCFSDRDKDVLSGLSHVESSKTLKSKLSLIVFGFADKLLELAGKKDYDGIISSYYTYMEY